MGSNNGYQLQGSLLEACSCEVLCPCWIGEDPDHGDCQSFNAYHFDRGTVGSVDVGGLSLVNVCYIPGNVLTPGSWRVVTYIDERASDEQFEAIRAMFAGELGGPLGDLAGLVGEVMAVKRAPIVHETAGGKGVLKIGDFVSSEMQPYAGPDGTTTTLRDSIFSTVPGSPAYVAKATTFRVDIPEHGMQWSYEGTNAIQSDWTIDYAGG